MDTSEIQKVTRNYSNCREILLNKLKDKCPVYKNHVTADEDDGWDDAIKQARGYGISIKSFGDTCGIQTKFVVTPAHLGYSFDYSWGLGSYGYDCWDRGKLIFYDDKPPKRVGGVSIETINKANSELFEFCDEIKSYCKYINICKVGGDERGYLRSRLINFNLAKTEFSEGELNGETLVAFVYGITPSDLLKQFDTKT